MDKTKVPFYRTAKLVKKHHGEDASTEAAMRADKMLEMGIWTGGMVDVAAGGAGVAGSGGGGGRFIGTKPARFWTGYYLNIT